MFTLDQLEQLWERATTLPAVGGHASNGPLTNAIIGEAIEGSDDGEYPLILEILDRISEDIRSFQTIITWAATYRYQPCRGDAHEDCVGEVEDGTFAKDSIPPFCTCPCHGERATPKGE